MDYKLYAACCGSDTLMTLTLSDGILRMSNALEIAHPMYLAESASALFALSLAPFEDSEESALLCYEKSADGLRQYGAPRSTLGIEACHLCMFEGHLYYTNYFSGSIASDNGAFALRKGNSLNPARQSAAHPHQIIPTPDGRLAVCDLGCDAIAFYDGRLKLLNETHVVPGSGVRHAVFFGDGEYLYSVGELDSIVRKYRYHGGNVPSLEQIGSASALALALSEPVESYAAAIRLDNKTGRLFVSNRGQNTISVLKADGNLHFSDSVSCGGSFPRDFDISQNGRYLVCANELSGSLTVFELDEVVPRMISEFRCCGHPMRVLFSKFS